MRALPLSALALAFIFIAQGTAPAQAGAPPVQGSQVPTVTKTAANPTTSIAATTPCSEAGNGDGFVIGVEDVLGVIFWRDQDMSGDVTVRPDGMITIPLIRDIKAVGLTPCKLADRIQQAAREYITDASVTVVVRTMNSRKVFITGEVTRPGAYSLASPMTVMQLIAVAGGLNEFAAPRKIRVLRSDGGLKMTFPFDYRDVAQGKKPEQNIALKPGDTVVVPER